MNSIKNKHNVETGEAVSNIFEAIGFANADEMMAKAKLAHSITSIIKHRHLTQEKTAQL